MRALSRHAGLGALVLIALAGCDLPGKPKAGPEVPRPEEVLAFDTLYGANCAGCHGANGQNGPATNLANPEYQALIDDASLREVIAKGEKGSLMPAFAEVNGGTLTDAQVDALVQGIRARGHRQVLALDGPAALAPMVRPLVTPGDYVVCLGAGNITQWAYALPGELAALGTG